MYVFLAVAEVGFGIAHDSGSGENGRPEKGRQVLISPFFEQFSWRLTEDTPQTGTHNERSMKKCKSGTPSQTYVDLNEG